MRLIIAATVALCASAACAQPTPQELRDLARAGDVESLEAAFVTAFDDFQADTLGPRDLRRMVNALNVTDPAIRAGLRDWQAAFPQSPFAASVMAFVLHQDSFALRGTGTIRETYDLALTAFDDLQAQSLDLAAAAYRTAPGYPPASDAVMVLQTTNRSLTPDEFDAVVATAMAAAPARDTLWRATFQASPQWGGGGEEEVARLCALFAGQVTDVADYDPDTCLVDNLTRDFSSSFVGEAGFQLLLTNPHPILDAARQEWDPPQLSPEQMVDILSDPATTDIVTAQRYGDVLAQEGKVQEAIALTQRVAMNVIDAARTDLRDDPYNPEVLDELLETARFFGAMSPLLTPAEELAYTRDRVIAMPLIGSNWAGLASAMNYQNGPPMDVAADRVLINAIVYSNHDSGYLSNYVYAKQVALRNLSRAVEDGAPQPPIEEVANLLICPMIRAERLYEAVCQMPKGSPVCDDVDTRATEVSMAAEPAITAGLCDWEQYAPLDELVFEPQVVDLLALTPP